MSARARLATVAGILLLAVAVRLWGIRYGLPWLFYFHDEPQIVLRALRFGTGDLNPHFFIWPGTLLLYLAFASYVALFAVGRLVGWWAGKEAFAAAYFRDPTAFYLLPRLHSVAFGVWTVWLAWGFGAAAYSVPVGLAAALGLAIHGLHAHYSHLAHPVTAMTAFTALGLWAAWRAATGGRPRTLHLAALAAGLGTLAQYHAALLAVPAAVAVAYRVADARGAERARWLLHGVLAGLLAVGVFLALSPYVVLDFRTFRADLTWIAGKVEGNAGGPPPGLLAGLATFWGVCLRPTLHLPLALAAGVGVLVALVRRTRADVLLLAYGAAYTLLASRSGALNDRYALPLVVPALLLTARAVEAALARLGAGPGAMGSQPGGGSPGWLGSPRGRLWAVPLALFALSLPSLAELVETDWTMTREDTRVAALRWFEAHVPEDEKVVIDMLRFWNSASPPLAENRACLEQRIAEAGHGLSGAGHSSVYADYYRFRLENLHHPAYELRGTEMGRSLQPLDTLRREGFRWVVVSDLAVQGQTARAAAGDSTGLRWYRALERDAVRMAEFAPRPWVRRGPRITVYRLGPAAGGPP
jgi:hypothetical protein